MCIRPFSHPPYLSLHLVMPQHFPIQAIPVSFCPCSSDTNKKHDHRQCYMHIFMYCNSKRKSTIPPQRGATTTASSESRTRLGSERLGRERLGSERLGRERLGSERLGRERLGRERPAAAAPRGPARSRCSATPASPPARAGRSTHTHTRAHARTHAHAHARTHARARAHTHTHTQWPVWRTGRQRAWRRL